MEVFKGPLGSHRNFIIHIAIENYKEYKMLCGLNEENGKQKTPDKYKELRYFVNSIESFNNILDYFFYENEAQLSPSKLHQFKRKIWDKYPELEELSKLANAYKHCVRENHSVKSTNLPWAKDLQKPQLSVNVNVSKFTGLEADVNFEFSWPITKYESLHEQNFIFWLKYIQSDGLNLINV